MPCITHICFKFIILAIKIPGSCIYPERIETHQHISQDIIEIRTFQQTIQNIQGMARCVSELDLIVWCIKNLQPFNGIYYQNCEIYRAVMEKYEE